jgi:hypothetical protein
LSSARGTKTLCVLVFGVWGGAPNSTQGVLEFRGAKLPRRTPQEFARARDRSGILFRRRRKRYKRIARSLHRRDAPISEWKCTTTISLQHRPEGPDAPKIPRPLS